MKTPSLLLAITAMALSGSPAMALGEDHRAFVAATYVSPQSDSSIDFGATRETVEVADAMGWSLGGEWRWSRFLGIELAYAVATHDIEIAGEAVGDIHVFFLDMVFNVHFLDSGRVDFYGGPTISFTDWGEMSLDADGMALTGEDELDVEGNSTWGLSAGIDIGLAERFAIIAGVRWVNQEIDLGDFGELSVFPFQGRLGFGVRW